MTTVPLWLVACLGKTIQLPNGAPGRLSGIQAFRGEIYATVQVNEKDDTDEENFPIGALRPTSPGASFSLDLEAGDIRF